MKNIKAVFFDMGGTIDLYDYSDELRLERTPGIQEILLSAGIDLGLNNEELYEVVKSGLKKYRKYSLKTLEEISPQRVWCEYILAEQSVDKNLLTSISENLMCYIETKYFDRPMRPEIPSMLESIRDLGLKIGLISNVNSLGQVPLNLAEYKIKQYFDPIVLSSEYGLRKPEPAIFHYAARLINEPTSACVHVGDRISRDIVGAQKAGFGLTVQIKHYHDYGEADIGATPDHIIEDMTEILDILKQELAQSKNRKSSNGKKSSQIRAILFDAGDVLYYRPNRREKFKNFLSGIGINNNNEINKKEMLSLKEKAYRGQISQEEYQEEYLRLHGASSSEHIELGKKYLKNEKNTVDYFDGVQETLAALKDQGFLLGVITDTANTVHAKLNWFENGGFGHVWDSIISSREAGVRKPDPKIYLAGLKQLGIKPEEAIFIGHKISELDGARAVGMKTAAFNYDEAAEADYYLEEFKDLLNVPILS